MARTRIDGGNGIRFLVPSLILCTGLAIHAGTLLNHDVAWFSWGAREWLRGAVIGRDLTDPNFPLAFLLYVPPAAMVGLPSFPFAIRLWIVMLAAAVMALAWRDVPQRSRLVVFSTLAIFVVIGWPREFGQREQIAMLLVFPYVLPVERSGWRAIAVGALAGIGFAVKPHFLVAWLLIEIGRKLLRPEQIGLMAAGALYALALVVVFPAFTFELLPTTIDVYGAFNRTKPAFIAVLPLSLAATAFALATATYDRFAKALAIAAFGFGISGVLQMKFYPYQFVPAWGFAMVAISALLCSTQGARRVIVALLILLATMYQAQPAWAWWFDVEDRAATQSKLLGKLNGTRSFAVIGVHPYPAFPTAIDAEALDSHFLGTANSSWFLPAAAVGNIHALSLAKQQLLVDLRRRPEIVIVDTNWHRHTNLPSSFDGLALLLADADIAREWASYRQFGAVDALELYRRR